MSYTHIEICQMCQNKAGVKFRTTKEMNGWVMLPDGRRACRVTVPKGRKAVKKGTLGSIKRQLLFDSMADFDRFMNCSLNSQEYIEMVEKKKKKK